MEIKALGFAVSSAIALVCAGTSDALGSPPGHAGPPGGGGPPGLSDPPGNSEFGHSRGGGAPTVNPLPPPDNFLCSYDADGVIATWDDTSGGCGPEYGGDLSIDVEWWVECVNASVDAGTDRLEFSLDTDPAAVWNFSCPTGCKANGSWEDINAAIETVMALKFENTCEGESGFSEGDWMLTEDSVTHFFNGIFADVKGLCPGRFGGRQNHEKTDDACESAL